MKHTRTGIALALVLFFFIPSLASAGDWIIENTTNQKWFEKMKARHLAINTSGLPCVAFGGDHLYYAQQDAGGAWNVSTVDGSSGVGTYASLALFNGVSPRIVYTGFGQGFGYAEGTWVDGAWQWAIEEIPGQGTFCSLALDSNGYPHIAYYAFPSGLRYIRKSAGGWSTPVSLDPPGEISYHYSIVLDQNDVPHIVSTTSTGDLYYHYYDVSRWRRAVLSNGAHPSVAPCMRSTPGTPESFMHLVFFDDNGSGGYDLRYLSFAGKNAGILIIDEEALSDLTVPQGSSLSMDMLPTSQPHVAYTLAGQDYIYRCVRPGPSPWQTWALAAEQPSDISIALDSLAVPVFSYRTQDQGISMASVSINGSGNWKPVSEYAPGGDASTHASLAVLGDGHPVLAYRDSSGRGMRVRKRAGESNWLPFANDDDKDCGEWVSIAPSITDPQQLHAAYYVADDGNLRYQRTDGTPVEGPSDVDSTDDVGTHASLALHPVSGNPSIAYRDETNQQLKFINRSTLPGGTPIWGRQVLDSTVGTGAYASLAYDSAGHPHIGYRSDASGGDLRAISNTGSGWGSPETVMLGTDPLHIAITTDAANRPHISFIRASDRTLWHAWKSITGWSWEDVPGVTGADGDTGIVIDGAGQPNILYRDGEHIMVARKRADGSTWHLDRVTSLHGDSLAGDLTTDMILGPNGLPMLSYYDPEERDMMVAWLQEPGMLAIQKTSPDHYLLQWSGDDHDIWIERSPTLLPGSWTPAAGPVQDYFHTIHETEARMFYRLRSE